MSGAEAARSSRTLTRARLVCESVPDPELPAITIGDLGIVRDVRIDAAGCVEVLLTPTYSGCPATEVIRGDVVEALRAAGFAEASARTVLSPAWTTDWISSEGRRKLADNGIVPPVGLAAGGAVSVPLSVRCPRCGSSRTRLVSRFGATACQAMYRCEECSEPFDYLKTH